ncbi:MAG: class I SAM-dependent methyltransferase [Spirochaetia bacterium]|nr:class I SAM-dependent methyltransferase [Spirochaetia bacterium]
MGYFDEEKNVEEYIRIAEGYDGRELIEVLKKYLPEDSSVLELGMGPGKDLEILSETFQVTGSDNSLAFLDRYKTKNKTVDLLLLNAVEMNIKKKFDGIYSNKVLHHLSKEELKKSLIRQAAVLNKNGILFHSFWYGDKEEEYSGLRFTYYTEKTFLTMPRTEYELLEIQSYSEMEKDDSLYIVLRKN